MYVRLYLFAAATATLALAGCRNDAFLNAQVDTMRVEYAALENDYFDLEDEYFAKLEELEACRGGEETTETDSTTGGDRASDDTSGDTESGDFTPPRIEFGTPGAPDIEFGTPVDPSELQPGNSESRRRMNNDGAGLVEPSNAGVGLPVEEINYVAPSDKHITHIVINPYLTTGHDFDSKPGDDGIALLIEPRNGDDQLVPAAGKISIVVLDPALDGDASRVARWDFSSDEAERRVKSGSDRNRGVSFKLPWPGNPPEHSKLHVFVRMETDEGKTLEADSEFYVILPGQFSQRWTPLSTSGRPGLQLTGNSETKRFATVPAQHEAESVEAGVSPAAHESPLVKQDSGEVETMSAGRDNKTLSSAQSNRPVWKPYR